MSGEELNIKIQNELQGRVNVRIRKTVDDQLVFIYDDHRWILNVLFTLYKNRIHPNLIYFDAHDDAARCRTKSELLRCLGVEELPDASLKQFSAFVDFDQRVDDGGWLSTALELNLIGDVVNIGSRYKANIQQMNGSYVSEAGDMHNVFELASDLEYELGCRGALGDLQKEDEYCKLRDFFGINKYYNNKVRVKSPYVLDFDLDFFTISSDNDRLHGWTEKVLQYHFPLYSKQYNFLRDLIRGASIITICREPDYCGSLGDSNRILEMLDSYFFEGYLGTDVTL